MNHKSLISQMVSLFLVVLVSAACGTVQPTPTPVPPTPTPIPTATSLPTPTTTPTATSLPIIPKLVNHPVPHLTVNTDWVEKAGCTPGDRGWDCAPAGPLGTLGCEEIRVDDLLGGLSPSDPLVECVNNSGELQNSSKFRKGGCMFPVWITRVLFKDNAYQLVRGADELQTVFAPVESSDEALSYALAATNLYAEYGQEVESEWYRYLVDELEDTHVDETEDGYLVHLFAPFRPGCGCGVHTVDAVAVHVTRDGQVTETDSQPVYELDACID